MLLTLCAFAALALDRSADSLAADPLAAGFAVPPAAARPHTWWHWMDGNVTKEGITADLEAMKQAGIGGAQMFTVAQGIPKGPAGYMSPLWREMITHAVKEAGRLGIELCIHNCAGWSSSGGPWVEPENAMQVVSWSQTQAYGPSEFAGVLPPIVPPHTYASIPFSRDIAVYAFPTPAGTATLPKDGRLLGKTGVHRMDGLTNDLEPQLDPPAIPTRGLVDLTSKLDKNGKLTWSVPPGNWTILRMGHVPTGKDNHPAPPEGDGLEVDKLSRKALDDFWDGMMAKVIADIGPLAGKVLNNALVDSYEVGGQNWTPDMAAEFKRRRGYDAMPYLPTLAGYIVEDREHTERFLWDYRRTIADLYADNYFGYFGELCHRNGLQFSTEPYGNGGFDNIQAGGKADIPMGEFWLGGGTLETTRVAASVGHVYGRPIIGAESFTADDNRGKWLEEPYSAKALGDLVFTHGINRYIFHRYAHQPWMNLKPGMTMGPWGTHLERTQTWWTEAATWLKYVARCQYLLQKGRFVADALYYYGESAPVDLPYGSALKPSIPKGYDYDGCDATIVMRATVRNGQIVLPSGMTYRVLVLPETTFMRPAMARRIKSLVAAGATIVGPKPTSSPSLTDYPACDDEVRSIGNEVWQKVDGEKVTEVAYGKGRIVYGKTLQAVFDRLRVGPDFSYKSSDGGSRLASIHRKIDGADVYFVSNQEYRPTSVECSFRVQGRQPELWHADSGRMELAPIYRSEGSRTVVPLQLDPAQSVFVVFRKPLGAVHLTRFGLDSAKPAVAVNPKIVIKRARYETADGRGTDVTATVAQMVKEGQTEIPATNSVFGDPVVNVIKQLVVEYELDGKATKQVVPENGTAVLLRRRGGNPAAYSLRKVATGLELVPWKAGTYSGQTAAGKPIRVKVSETPITLGLSSGWRVNFPPNWGAPASIDLPRLTSWSLHPDKGVKYFSGSATYVKTFQVPAGMVGAGRELRLELGTVKNFATVRLNGKALEVLWKEPFAVDLGHAIRTGENRLEIKVTNLWPNRIIGDEQLKPDVEWEGVTLKGWPDWLSKGQPRPKTGRYTFTTWKFWNKDSPLLESGLLGPVVLKSTKRIPIKL